MGAVISELAEPLLQRFPDLRPEQLGGPYKIDPAIYQPHFYEGYLGGNTKTSS